MPMQRHVLNFLQVLRQYFLALQWQKSMNTTMGGIVYTSVEGKTSTHALTYISIQI